MNILFAADTSFYYFGEDYPGDTAAFAAMAEVRERFNEADFTVINLESTIGNRENYVPIRKNGPNQMSAPAFAKYIEYLAPSAAGLANNHMGDFGDAPIFHTIDTLKKLGVTPFGAGANIRDAYKPVCFEKNGSKVSVIAVCENEFGIATEDKAGSAGYSLGRVTAAIRDARADGYIPVVFFHGGNEFFAFPAPAKKELYRHFVDIGAGAVVAMHTHCPQGYEVYNDAPIVYSMGNFFFPASNNTGRQRFKTWEYGYMCELSFENSKVEINELIPYRQDFSGVHLLCGEERAYFVEYLNVISAPIADDALLQKYFGAWSVKTSPLSKMRRSIDLSYDNMSRVKNLLCCEAHNDVLKAEAIVRFEGREASLEALCADIEKLQEMEIPR